MTLGRFWLLMGMTLGACILFIASETLLADGCGRLAERERPTSCGTSTEMVCVEHGSAVTE